MDQGGGCKHTAKSYLHPQHQISRHLVFFFPSSSRRKWPRNTKVIYPNATVTLCIPKNQPPATERWFVTCYQIYKVPYSFKLCKLCLSTEPFLSTSHLVHNGVCNVEGWYCVDSKVSSNEMYRFSID